MKNIAFLISFIAAFSLPLFAQADAPAPPPFTASFTYENQNIADNNFSVVVLKCSGQINSTYQKIDTIPQLDINQPDPEKNCNWIPVGSGNCQSDSSCYFSDGYYLGELKFAVYIPSLDKTFISGAIERNYLGHYGSDTPTEYSVQLFEDDSVKVDVVQVDKGNWPEWPSDFISLMVLGLIVTVLLEGVVLLIFFLLKQAPKRAFLGLLIGNVISVPFVWFADYYIPLTSIIFILEIIAVVFEAWIFRLITRKALSWKKALLISLIMNIVSFFLGQLIIP
ncbi:MAG: hypothetical protein PHE52_00735 [Candidatus Pacebacteria bacterium]|nr:hypothetical protein [Candidatus Paceibacterota bacterium]